MCIFSFDRERERASSSTTFGFSHSHACKNKKSSVTAVALFLAFHCFQWSKSYRCSMYTMYMVLPDGNERWATHIHHWLRQHELYFATQIEWKSYGVTGLSLCFSFDFYTTNILFIENSKEKSYSTANLRFTKKKSSKSKGTTKLLQNGNGK